MRTLIALLRGVNVGGANRLPMAELRSDLEALGFEHVRTYIQSGNVVFRSDGDNCAALADTIAENIEGRHGFQPTVIVLPAQRLRQAMAANPFPGAEAEPRTLHLYFLAGQPADRDLSALQKAATATERFHLGDQVLYLHTPDGYGRSKLASRIEAALGVPATARNWRTVTRLRAILDQGTEDAD